MKIVEVLPKDFVEHIGHCRDEALIRRFCGKKLLRIARLESANRRQQVISDLMEEFEV